MNKSLTVNSLAIGTIKARKKQYTIMIIGIIFAMLFSSCVIFSVSAALSSYRSLSQRKFGNQQALCVDADEAFFKEAAERKIVKKYGFAHIIGEAYSTEKDNYNSAVIAYLDENAYELFSPQLIKGKYPNRENEIAVEAISLSKMDIDADIGDEITLDFHVQNGEEAFEASSLKKYKLVGILENRAWNVEYQHSKIIPSAYVYSGAQVELGGKEGLMCCFDLVDGGFYLNGVSPIKIKGSNSEEYKRYTVSGALERLRDFYKSSLSIVNNTVTNNIRNSKRKIGTLRAVGADERVLTKAYIKQTVSMLSGGIIGGFGIFTVSYVTAALLFKKASSPYSVFRLSYNPLLAIIFTLAVIAVCSINLWLNLRKEMKYSIVDNIREL